jgi:hypothetical protein
MNAATLKGIRMVANEMVAGGCLIKAGDEIRTKNGGGHYVVRQVEWTQVIGEYVLTVSPDFRSIGRGVDKAVIRLPLSCFAA